MLVETADGLYLNVEVDGADGVPLVCLHGVAASSDEFGWLVPRLVEAGHRVVRVDFRGHGDSDRAERPYVGPDYVTDALAVLEGFEQPALLLGHSLGGIVALAVAQRHPELVRATLAIDPGLNVAEDLAVGDRLDNAVLEETLRLIRCGMPSVQASGITAEDFAAQLDTVPTPSGRPAGEVYAAGTTQWWANSQLRLDLRVLDGVVDPTVTWDRVPFDIDRPVPVPVLVLLADPARPDAIVGDARQAQLEAAGSPDLEAVVVPGAGHNLQDELAHRTAFLAHLDRWLATHG